MKEDGPEALETRDARGNRALHLALKFAHRDATAIVKALLVRVAELWALQTVRIMTISVVSARTLVHVCVLEIPRAGRPFTMQW